MVSQGAQTNGGLNGRKLTKSLSEVGGPVRLAGVGAATQSVTEEIHLPVEDSKSIDHEFLHRTQSEEPPKSPFTVTSTGTMSTASLTTKSPQMPPHDITSRSSSRFSQIETSRSDTMSFDNALTHSRNNSQDSATSFRSTEISTSRASYESSSYKPDTPPLDCSIGIQHYGSHLMGSDYLTGRTSTELEPIHRHQNGFVYETQSLPRRPCVHHPPREEFHSHSLPRRESQHHHHHVHEYQPIRDASSISLQRQPHQPHHQHQHPQQKQPQQQQTPILSISDTLANKKLVDINSIFNDKHSQPRRTSSNIVQPHDKPSQQRRASYAVTAPVDTHTLKRRNSSHQTQFIQPQFEEHQIENMRVSTDESCSTCDSEDDESEPKEEKEIIIDFKPRISPVPSPSVIRRKKLHKTLSDGEILIEKRKEKTEATSIVAASEEDLKPSAHDTPTQLKNFHYTDSIRDEGICCKTEKYTKPAAPQANGSTCYVSGRYMREVFRKRSISLEDPTAPDVVEVSQQQKLQPLKVKSSPPSPFLEELMVQVNSQYPSCDSLATEALRDHSDSIWNESQITVLPAAPRLLFNLVNFF